MLNGSSDGQQLLVRSITQLIEHAPSASPEGGPGGFYPGVSAAPTEAVEEATEGFIIVHDDGTGAPKMHWCDDPGSVKRFLEMLIAEGAKPDAVRLFQASPASFNVRFQPIVDLVP